MNTDEHITMNAARELLPGRNGRISLASIYRFATIGARPKRSLPPIVLQTFLSGGTRFTRPSWCQEFLRALNEAGGTNVAPRPESIQSQRGRASQAGRALLGPNGLLSAKRKPKRRRRRLRA